MTVNTVVIEASRDEVFAAVCDVRRYPAWLVGADHIRSVDPDWPAVGSRFRHVIGAGPVKIRDATVVAELEPPSLLRLRAGMGRLGVAGVCFRVAEAADAEDAGDGARTELQILEEPTGGPVRLLWRTMRPLVATLLWGRNAASLESFKHLVEEDRPDGQ